MTAPAPLSAEPAIGAADDGGERWYSFADAARACGVSRDTVKRRHRDGAFSGARRGYGSGPGGPWLVPEADLLAAGLLRPGAARAGRPADGADASASTDLVARLAAAEATVAAQARHLHDLRSLLCPGPLPGHVALGAHESAARPG